MSASVAKGRPSDSEHGGLSGHPHPPSDGGAQYFPVVTCQAEPWSGLPVVPPQPDFPPSAFCTLPVSLTGLVAPSGVLSFRGVSLLLLLLVDTVCLPRPGALASASPASTPLSSLSVCPLSESWESVEAAGGGNRRGVCRAGVSKGFLQELRGRLEGWVGKSPGRLPATRHLLRPALPTGSGPKAAISRMSALTASGKMVFFKKKVKRQIQPTYMGLFVGFNS